MPLKFTSKIEPNYNGTLIDSKFVNHNNATLESILSTLLTGQVKLSPVNVLPAVGVSNVIYLLKQFDTDGTTVKFFKQYIYADGDFIYTGDTQAELTDVLTIAMLGGDSDVIIKNGYLKLKEGVGGGGDVIITDNEDGTYTLEASVGSKIDNIVTLGVLAGYVKDGKITINGMSFDGVIQALSTAVTDASNAINTVNAAIEKVLVSIEIKSGMLYAHYSNEIDPAGTLLGEVIGPRGQDGEVYIPSNSIFRESERKYLKFVGNKSQSEVKVDITEMQGSNGSNAHVKLIQETDADNYKHAYIKTWEGDVEPSDSASNKTEDLYAAVNDILRALDEIMNNTSTLEA